jgi:hypothetical protein
LPEQETQILHEISLAIHLAIKERSCMSLKKHIGANYTVLESNKRQFFCFMSSLNDFLNKTLVTRSIPEELIFGASLSRAQLLYIAKTLLPAWEELLAGNILPLFNRCLAIESSPQLLYLASSVLILVDKSNKKSLPTNLDRFKFYIDQLLAGNILVDELDTPII